AAGRAATSTPAGPPPEPPAAPRPAASHAASACPRPPSASRAASGRAGQVVVHDLEAGPRQVLEHRIARVATAAVLGDIAVAEHPMERARPDPAPRMAV